MKKRIIDSIEMLDDICVDLEEIYVCDDLVWTREDTEGMMMGMSPEDHLRLFESMQNHIEKIRAEVEFLLSNVPDNEEIYEDFPDNEETLCDRCNKRLSRKERNR